jgi:hypothetical protein
MLRYIVVFGKSTKMLEIQATIIRYDAPNQTGIYVRYPLSICGKNAYFNAVLACFTGTNVT